MKMTVGDLIDYLQQLPPECDRYSVSIYASGVLFTDFTIDVESEHVGSVCLNA